MKNWVLDVARIHGPTSVEGPGLRVALWVRGCSLQCHGCFNPHLWESSTTSRSVDATLQEVRDIQSREPEIEGITLLGGEPFEQAAPLAILARELKRRGLSVVTFTGYTLEALKSKSSRRLPGAQSLLDETDLLVDGPFLQSRLDTRRPWLGSTNQRYRFLTSRYQQSDVEVDDGVEITVRQDGTVVVNGWDRPEALASLVGTVGGLGGPGDD